MGVTARDQVLRIASKARPFIDRSGIGPWIDLHLIRLAGLSALLRHTDNFARTTWLGQPIWQNLADIWTIQELIVEREVDFVVECGTNRGGSAFFMATVFDLLDRGQVLTIDVERLATVSHPRIEFLHGSSTDEAIVGRVRERVREASPHEVLVVLDSDHSAAHVLGELRAYADLVPIGGYVVVQDGMLDELPGYRDHTPGPLAAIREFVRGDTRFEVDEARSGKFLFHSSPSGCLRRLR